MRRVGLIAVVCLWLAGCTTASSVVATGFETKTDPGARVLLVEPDVQLGLLNAGGVVEPRADWSEASRANIAGELKKELAARGHGFAMVNPDEAMGGRIGQLLRLNQLVIDSVPAGGLLPTKKGSFDWTLGEGAQAIGQAYDGDYALFVSSRGSWSSGGRYVAFIAVAAVGGAIPMGGQSVTASLVDLRTGRIVWYNTTYAGPGDDIRTAEGADTVVKAVLKKLPL